jgi:integrase/recombinase XerC
VSQAPCYGRAGSAIRLNSTLAISGKYKADRVMKKPAQHSRPTHASLPRTGTPANGNNQVRSPTLLDAICDYLGYLRACGRSPSTIESYAGSLALLTDRIAPNTALDSVSADFLHVAVAAMGNSGQRRAPHRSESTLNRHRTAYRVFWKWAFETGRTARNPAVLLHLANIESPPTLPIMPAEIRALFSAIRRSGDPLRLRDEALFRTYAMTGIRRCEALQLDVSDFDSRQQTLRVRNAKGRRVRTIPVAPALGALLSELLDIRLLRGERDKKLFAGRIPKKGLTARQAQARFDLWKAIAKLPRHLTIHSFRVGFATALYARSRDLVLVSRALGHKDVRPTLRYIHVLSENLRQAIDGLGRDY